MTGSLHRGHFTWSDNQTKNTATPTRTQFTPAKDADTRTVAAKPKAAPANTLHQIISKFRFKQKIAVDRHRLAVCVKGGNDGFGPGLAGRPELRIRPDLADCGRWTSSSPAVRWRCCKAATATC
jgi:hypothetical protein